MTSFNANNIKGNSKEIIFFSCSRHFPLHLHLFDYNDHKRKLHISCGSKSILKSNLIYLFYSRRFLRHLWNRKWQSARWRNSSILFPNRTTGGTRKSENEEIAPETSVPRDPPPCCPSKTTGNRTYVRRNIAGRRVFIVPSHQWEQRGVIAVIGPRGVSLSISIVRRWCRARGIAITRLVSSRRPYRTALIIDEQCDFTLTVGQLIIDGPLTRSDDGDYDGAVRALRADRFMFLLRFPLPDTPRPILNPTGALSSRLSIRLRRVCPLDGLPIDNR